MPEVTFQPGSDSGALANSMMNGVNLGASLYQRKQAMNADAERLEIEKRRQSMVEEANNVLRPVREAQAAADLTAAQTTIESAVQEQVSRKQAMELLPSARAEFNALMQETDMEKRAEAGLRWVSKYGQLDNLKELNGEFSSKKDIVAKLHSEVLTVKHLRAQTEAQKELIAARGTAAEGVAKVRNDKLTPMERYKQKRDEAAAAGDQDGVAFYDAIIQKQNAAPISTAEGSDQFQQRLADVMANGTPEEKAFWTQRAKAINTRGVKSSVTALRDAILGTPAPATAPSTQTAPAPAQNATPAPATSISNLRF